MTEPDPARRWDGDERGSGPAGASGFAPRLEQLREHARRPDWVAEEPDAHLWPHLERAISSAGSPWRLAMHSTDPDGRFVIELEYRPEAGEHGPGRLRADALRLVGLVAESTTFVEVVGPGEGVPGQVVRGGDTFVVNVVTGMLDDQTRFRAHGHTLQIRIRVRQS